MKLTLFFLFVPSLVFAQTTAQVIKKLGPNPLMIKDSVIIDRDELKKISANDIADLTILYDTSAVKHFGEDAKDGAIIMETKVYARKRYTAFLRKTSLKYDSLYNITKSDSTFQYILNDSVRRVNYEGDLETINFNPDLFISLSIITADDLKNKYNITDKNYGIVIYSRDPKDYLHKNN